MRSFTKIVLPPLKEVQSLCLKWKVFTYLNDLRRNHQSFGDLTFEQV